MNTQLSTRGTDSCPASGRLAGPAPSGFPRTRLQSLLLMLWLALTGLVATPTASAQAPSDKTLHVFVVDHSYSMMNLASGETRWDFVVRKMREWFGTLPTDGSADVSILLFNQFVPAQRLRGSRPDPWVVEFPSWSGGEIGDADAFVRRRVGEPQEGEGTALWNALGWTMRKIDLQAAQYADCWIYLFTDGEDTNSKQIDAQPFTFPKGPAGKDPTLAAWRKLIAEHPATYMIEQPLGGMQPPLEPEPANPQIYTSRPELRDVLKVRVSPPKNEFASIEAPREIALQVQLAGTGKKRLPADARFRLAFDSETPGVELAVEPETLAFTDGKQSVTVRLASGDPSKGVQGRLRLSFPQVERTDVLGPTEIPIRFAEPAKVSISQVSPAASIKWPVGRPLPLQVKHTGERVEWDLGDGTRSSEPSLTHTYARPGEYQLSVSAHADGRESASRRMTVTAIEAGIVVRQEPDQGVITGRSVSFSATVSAGTVKQFDWTVDGAVRSASGGIGGELEHVFEESGSREVVVRAFTEDLGILERRFQIQVGEGLSVRIASFASSVDAGLEFEFGAEVKGSLRSGRIAWALLDESGNPIDATAQGSAPIASGTSSWRIQVPRNAPARVRLSARAEVTDEEKARFGEAADEVVLSVRPPGLHTKKERPVDADTLVLGGATPFEARWSGTRAADVAEIQWTVQADGAAVQPPSRVQPSRSESAVASSYQLDLGAAEALLGKQVSVTGTPLVDGAPVAEAAATWRFTVRLPRLDYQIVTRSLDVGALDYGKRMQVEVQPTRYLRDVTWFWGDGQEQSGAADEPLDHEYGLDAGGAREIRAELRRIDGSVEVLKLPFEFRVPTFAIRAEASVRIGASATLSVGPESLRSMISQVEWDFGGGYQPPEADAETSYRWVDRAGPVNISARVTLADGSERTLGATLRVDASATVKAAPEVLGGETHGSVELRANVSSESDYRRIRIEVSRDGESLGEFDGEVATHVIPEGEFGDYLFRFTAERVPTEDNPESTVLLGEIGRTYRLRRWALAIGTLASAILLLYVLARGFLVQQYPRTWRLRVTTENPWRDGAALEDLDARPYRLDQGGRKKRPHWGLFQWTKELRVQTKDLIQVFDRDEIDEGLKSFEQDANVLRIRATGEKLLDSPGEGWSGPRTHESKRDLRIFTLTPPRRDVDAKALYAWLDSKAPTSTGWIISIIGLISLLAAWLWFAMTHCNLFR